MRNLKRALSLAMASVMLLGMMVVGTGASYADVTSEDNKEAIEVMQAIGVMVGDTNGNFNPDQKVTRGEMAVVMANLLDLKVEDFVGAKTPFTDVPEWAVPYVAACYADGITAGISATQYGFNYEVTTTQAALMMMKALGYFQYAKDFGSDWQVATVKQGSKINLFDGVSSGASAAMTRNDVAQIALNTLEATMVETDGSSTDITLPGDISISTGDTKYVEVTIATGSYGDAIDRATDGTKDIVQLGEKLFDGDLEKNPTTKTDRMGRVGNYWVYDNKEIGTYAKEADATYVVADGGMNVNEILADSDYFNYNTTQVSGATQAKTFLNGDSFTTLSIALNTSTEAQELQKGDVVEVYLNSTTKNVDTVVIGRYSLAKVDDVDTDLDSSLTNKGITAEISLVDLDDHSVGGVFYNDTNDKAGSSDKDKVLAGYNANTYTEGTYLAVALDNTGNKIVDSYVVTPVTGNPSAFRTAELVGSSVIDEGYITVGGTQYTFAGTVYGVDTTTSFDFDSSYEVYATKQGYAIGVKGASGVNLNDVYYVVGLYQTTSDMGTASYYAQVVAMDGTVSSIKLEKTSYDAMLKKDGSDSKLYIADGSLAGTKDSNTTSTATAGKLYVPAEASHLYTFTDNSAEGDTDAGNGKYTGKAYNGGTSYDVTVADINGAVKGDDTRFEVDGGTTARFFVSSNTSFIASEKSGDDLKVTTATGGMKAADNTNVVVIAKDSTPRDAALVIYVGTDLSATVASDDVVYLAKRPTEQNAQGYKATLYFMENNSTQEVILDKDDSALTPGFYVYDLENGVYTLTKTGLGSAISSSVDNDTEGYVEGLAVTAHYGDTLTATNFTDVDYSKAIIMDNRSNRSSSEYANEIVNAKRLGDAIDAVKAAGKSLKVNVYVVDGNITLVDVVGINSVAAPSITGQPSNETFAEGTASKTLTVTASGDGLTYQWYKGTDAISGATSASLDLSAMNLTPGVYKFKVVVTSNKDGATNSTTSNEATVTVQPAAPSWTDNTSVAGVSGQTVTIKATTTAFTAGTYTLYKGGVSTGCTVTVSGEAVSELAFTGVTDLEQSSTSFTITVTVNGVESAQSSSQDITPGA